MPHAKAASIAALFQSTGSAVPSRTDSQTTAGHSRFAHVVAATLRTLIKRSACFGKKVTFQT